MYSESEEVGLEATQTAGTLSQTPRILSLSLTCDPDVRKNERCSTYMYVVASPIVFLFPYR